MSSIILIAGDGGTGKSINAQRFPEEVAYLDFEYPKGDKCRQSQNPDRILSIFPCREYHGYQSIKSGGQISFKKAEIKPGFKKGQVNTESTMKLITSTIQEILDTSERYETIVLDSISDIREIVSEQWLIDYRKKGTKEAGRKTIGKDPSAWSAINKIVCDDILFPIINIGRIENKNIIFTSRMNDEYRVIELESGKQDTAKTGKRVIDTQDWVTFEIDIIAQLESSEKGRYFMTCKKTPKGVLQRQDITGKNVYEVLSEHGVI